MCCRPRRSRSKDADGTDNEQHTACCGRQRPPDAIPDGFHVSPAGFDYSSGWFAVCNVSVSHKVNITNLHNHLDVGWFFPIRFLRYLTPTMLLCKLWHDVLPVVGPSIRNSFSRLLTPNACRYVHPWLNNFISRHCVNNCNF